MDRRHPSLSSLAVATSRHAIDSRRCRFHCRRCLGPMEGVHKTTMTNLTSSSSSSSSSSSLDELGFEFRLVKCQRCHHQQTNQQQQQQQGEEEENENDDASLANTVQCDECASRLFHHDEMLTVETYPLAGHIPRGPIFDRVHPLCQAYTQTKLCQDFALRLITLFDNVRAFVSDSLLLLLLRWREDEPTNTTTTIPKPTLIIIGGKGISQCGMLSVRQLLGAGMERGSCAYHIRQALARQWHVIVLDPNADGSEGKRGSGYQVVCRSLDRLLFMDARTESISSQVMGSWDNDYNTMVDTDDGDDRDSDDNPQRRPHLYFLCHSAAGGYLVRYLLDQTPTFQRRIAKLCFSDSTHRLSWARPPDKGQHSYLHRTLLQDPRRSLYIRNNNLGRDYPLLTMKPGQECHVDHWWIHRYGSLRTVWAGTPDHSLVCWTARHVIWTFFDDDGGTCNGIEDGEHERWCGDDAKHENEENGEGQWRGNDDGDDRGRSIAHNHNNAVDF